MAYKGLEKNKDYNLHQPFFFFATLCDMWPLSSLIRTEPVPPSGSNKSFNHGLPEKPRQQLLNTIEHQSRMLWVGNHVI